MKSLRLGEVRAELNQGYYVEQDKAAVLDAIWVEKYFDWDIEHLVSDIDNNKFWMLDSDDGVSS